MPNSITFLDAVGALHPTKEFMMSLPHNGKLTEEEYNACYQEITGKTSDDTAVLSNDPTGFKVSYAQALAKYNELIG